MLFEKKINVQFTILTVVLLSFESVLPDLRADMSKFVGQHSDLSIQDSEYS